MAAHRKNNPGNRLSYLLCGTDCLFFCRRGDTLSHRTGDLVLGRPEKNRQEMYQQKN